MKPLIIVSSLLFISVCCFAQAKDSATAIRLEQYKKWSDQGFITADEYATLKQRLLKPRRIWDDEKGTSYFGVKVGTLMGLINKSSTLSNKSAPQPSYTAGIFYEYDRGHFMVKTELDVNGKSGYVNRPLIYFDADDQVPGYFTSVTRVNLEIPILLGGKFGNWSVYGGPVISTDLYSLTKSTDRYYDNNGVLQTYVYEDHTKLGLETDFMFGVGYAIPIRKKKNQAVVLDLRYANNMPGSDVYDRYATFTVGYKL